MNRLMDFQVHRLSFWKGAKNHLIDFEVTPLSEEFASAAFVAKHGGGIRLLITTELADHMIEQMELRHPPFMIAFEAERGGHSTLSVDAEMRAMMIQELNCFLNQTKKSRRLS